MKKIASILLVLAPMWLLGEPQASINPLAKIIITSNRATCQKDCIIPQQFNFNYQENVLVTFADKSTITANNLEIVFEGKDLGPAMEAAGRTKSNFLDKFKKIVFSGNVIFTSQNRIAMAKKAELQLAEHMCTLTGNVIIKQKKTTEKEVPIAIESDEAKLNLLTHELLLSGSMEKPVSTVISLEDYAPLKKVTKSKRRKKKNRKSCHE